MTFRPVPPAVDRRKQAPKPEEEIERLVDLLQISEAKNKALTEKVRLCASEYAELSKQLRSRHGFKQIERLQKELAKLERQYGDRQLQVVFWRLEYLKEKAKNETLKAWETKD
jgi:hypothetical protein